MIDKQLEEFDKMVDRLQNGRLKALAKLGKDVDIEVKQKQTWGLTIAAWWFLIWFSIAVSHYVGWI